MQGYQQYYYSDWKRKSWQNWRDNHEPSVVSSLPVDMNNLHTLSITNLQDSATPFAADSRLKKDALLYLSCIAGDSATVKRLCEDGVNAAVTGEPDGATCLHWLFNFPEKDMRDIAALLIRNGAQIDSKLDTTYHPISYTFPFVWPPGTALYWAVAASSSQAVKILLENGADYSSRNGEDPYMFDLNVRYLDQQEDGVRDMYSLPPRKCWGMTPIDIAICSQDVAILSEILAFRGRNALYFAADEEEYTPFHRLQYNNIGHMSNLHHFSFSAFNGSPIECRERISKVVSLLKQMGVTSIFSLNRPSLMHARCPKTDLAPLRL